MPSIKSGSGSAAPSTLVVNYEANTPLTDLAVGAIGTNGSVCVKTSSSTNFVVDVVGWYGA